MITIVLADDHQIVREGIQSLLESELDFQVVAAVGTGIEAVQLVESLQPDILVTDLMMGNMNGIEVTRQIRKKSSRTEVIILSMYSSEAYVFEALQAGVKGYVLKESSLRDLAQAICQVNDGNCYLSPPLSEQSLEAYRQRTKTTELNEPEG